MVEEKKEKKCFTTIKSKPNMESPFTKCPNNRIQTCDVRAEPGFRVSGITLSKILFLYVNKCVQQAGFRVCKMDDDILN